MQFYVPLPNSTSFIERCYKEIISMHKKLSIPTRRKIAKNKFFGKKSKKNGSKCTKIEKNAGILMK